MKVTILASDNATQRTLVEYLNERIPHLEAGQRYSLDAILGPEIWEDTDASHRALGRYFADMVSKGRVPFVTAGWTSDRHNRYRFTA